MAGLREAIQRLDQQMKELEALVKGKAVEAAPAEDLPEPTSTKPAPRRRRG